MTTPDTAPTLATAPTADAVDMFADFALNTEKESEGVWVPYRGDVEMLIARTGNRKYRKMFTAQFEKNRVILNGKGEDAEAKAEEILINVLASCILLGWKGSVVIQGVPTPYSNAAAKRLLALPLFREWVTARADDITAYKAVQEAEDQGN